MANADLKLSTSNSKDEILHILLYSLDEIIKLERDCHCAMRNAHFAQEINIQIIQYCQLVFKKRAKMVCKNGPKRTAFSINNDVYIYKHKSFSVYYNVLCASNSKYNIDK